jgi:hypothetical protein
MALNQTQRDHAITMVAAAITKKKEAFLKSYPKPSLFVLAELKNKGIKMMTIEQLVEMSDSKDGNPRMSWEGGAYKQVGWHRASDYKIDLFNLHDIGAKYKVRCNEIDDEFRRATAELDDLEKTLRGQIMFGTDYNVIKEALDCVENYRGTACKTSTLRAKTRK